MNRQLRSLEEAAWVADHPFKPGMPLQEVFELIEEHQRLFPLTREEDEERRKQKIIEVEFVL